MKHIVMIIAPENFRDEELFEPRRVLEQEGYTVTVASTKLGEITGSHGGTATAELLLGEVKPDDFDAAVFVGGSGASVLQDNLEAHRIAQDMVAKQKVVGAICFAPVIIAKAGVLRSKRFTATKEQVATVQALGSRYVDEGVVVDGNIVTADGPHSASDFGSVIHKLLSS